MQGAIKTKEDQNFEDPKSKKSIYNQPKAG
jgi:hypothetical protein